jgi:hypothetical protein
LRRNGTGACPYKGDTGTHSEESRGNRDANASCATIMRNNGPSHDASLKLSGCSGRNIVAKKSAFPHGHFSCQSAASSIIDRRGELRPPFPQSGFSACLAVAKQHQLSPKASESRANHTNG